MTEYFEGPRLKLNRAQEHIHELQQVLIDFIATKPYRINYKLNSDQTFYECRVYYDGRTPPSQIGILIGEIVYQLRSVLDHIIFELSVPQIRQIVDREAQIRATVVPQFPILTKRNERELSKRLKFVDKLVWDAVERYQPYDRTYSSDPTKHPLSLLQRLSNADKHRVIATTVGGIRLAPSEKLANGVEMERGRNVDDGEVIARVPAHLDPKQHFGPNLIVDILFDNARDPGIIRPITNVMEIHNFVRYEMLPYFTNVASQLSSSTK